MPDFGYIRFAQYLVYIYIYIYEQRPQRYQSFAIGIEELDKICTKFQQYIDNATKDTSHLQSGLEKFKTMNKSIVHTVIAVESQKSSSCYDSWRLSWELGAGSQVLSVRISPNLGRWPSEAGNL